MNVLIYPISSCSTVQSPVGPGRRCSFSSVGSKIGTIEVLLVGWFVNRVGFFLQCFCLQWWMPLVVRYLGFMVGQEFILLCLFLLWAKKILCFCAGLGGSSVVKGWIVWRLIHNPICTAVFRMTKHHEAAARTADKNEKDGHNEHPGPAVLSFARTSKGQGINLRWDGD